MGKGYFCDAHGNVLTNSVIDGRWGLSLFLKADGRTRKIGYIEDRTYYKDEPTERALTAFCFFYDVFTYLAPESVVVRYLGETYFIDNEAFNKKRLFINWRNIGLALRCYVPLHCFKRRR